jgi:hypothetical protein
MGWGCGIRKKTYTGSLGQGTESRILIRKTGRKEKVPQIPRLCKLVKQKSRGKNVGVQVLLCLTMEQVFITV